MSTKVGRNDRCPCGSGRKFKKCCGEESDTTSTSDALTGAIGVVIGDRAGRNIIVKKGFVLNQLRRDAPQIAQSFDRLCEADLETIDDYASRCFFTIYVGNEKADAEGEEWRATCGRLLLNALSTLLAAIDLARDGFILQPGILIRNIIETLTAVICIFMDKEHWTAFQIDKLRPEAELTTAKKFLPIFGPLYGFFSEQFAHVRQNYAGIHPIVEYPSREYAPLSANIRFIRLALWLIYVVTEVTFYEISEQVYWQALGGGQYQFDMNTAKGSTLLAELLGDDVEMLEATESGSI